MWKFNKDHWQYIAEDNIEEFLIASNMFLAEGTVKDHTKIDLVISDIGDLKVETKAKAPKKSRSKKSKQIL